MSIKSRAEEAVWPRYMRAHVILRVSGNPVCFDVAHIISYFVDPWSARKMTRFVLPGLVFIDKNIFNLSVKQARDLKR